MLVQSVELAQTLVQQVLSLSNVISTREKRGAFSEAPFFMPVWFLLDACWELLSVYSLFVSFYQE